MTKSCQCFWFVLTVLLAIAVIFQYPFRCRAQYIIIEFLGVGIALAMLKYNYALLNWRIAFWVDYLPVQFGFTIGVLYQRLGFKTHIGPAGGNIVIHLRNAFARNYLRLHVGQYALQF